jgi:hypothetical protein
MQPLTDEDKVFLAALKHKDFDCLPLRDQVRYFCDFAFDRGDTVITLTDYQELFAVAHLSSPRSGKPIQPTATKLRTMLEQLQATEAFPYLLAAEGCVVPWRALYQDWVFTFRALTASKAESLSQRLNSMVHGPQPFIPRHRRTDDGDGWSVGTSVRLQSRAWPCAVAEALHNGMAVSPEWTYQGDGKRIAIASAKPSNQPSVLTARWEIRAIPRSIETEQTHTPESTLMA